MKDNVTFRLLQVAMPMMTKEAMLTRQCRKAVLREYHAICARAKDIGTENPWLSCYAMGAWFIALNRCNELSADENYAIMERGMKSSWMFRTFIGSGDAVISRNRHGKAETWTADHADHPYENDWCRILYPQDKDCALAFDFTECGICKLCHDEGCFELAHYLCKLDFMMAEVMGLRLERTSTLANGDAKCDFRYYKV